MPAQRASLLSLPTELLLTLHHLSQSPSLPILNQHLHTLFSSRHNTSPHHRAVYLYRHHFNIDPPPAPPGRQRKVRTAWDAELRFGCCDLEVLEILCGWNLKERGESLRVRELPKRLFRHLTATDTPLTSPSLSFAHRLLQPPYACAPDKPHGYPLARAVLARNLWLIRTLLGLGAQVGEKDGLAVLVAVGRGDLDVVRMLVEPEFRVADEPLVTSTTLALTAPPVSEEPPSGKEKGKKGTSKRLAAGAVQGESPGKRRKVEDRLKVTDGMLEAAMKRGHVNLVEYFVQRGARPTLAGLNWLEKMG